MFLRDSLYQPFEQVVALATLEKCRMPFFHCPVVLGPLLLFRLKALYNLRIDFWIPPDRKCYLAKFFCALDNLLLCPFGLLLDVVIERIRAFLKAVLWVVELVVEWIVR